MKYKKWYFIVNTTAGNGKTGKKVNSLIQHLGMHNLDYEIELTRYAGHAQSLARAAALAGEVNIIAVGGDGTASEVASGIALSGNNYKVNLGIIPEGGGNDFCHNYHQSHNIEKSIRQLIDGKIKKVDLARTKDKYFLNTLGIGFDAQVAYHANKIHFLNGLPRYLVAVLISMFSFKNLPLRIIIDDKEELSGRFLMVSVGNGKYSGGGFKLNPDAMIDDDHLDIMLARDVSFLRVFTVLPKALEGLHGSEREISFLRCRKLEVFSKAKLPLYYDGEVPQLDNPHHVVIEIEEKN